MIPNRYRLRAPLAGLFSLCLLVVAHGASAQEVTIAVFDGAAPMVLTDEDGDAAGIFPEVLGRLLRDLDYEVRFVGG
ncbi:MAG: hypothetical protein ACOCYB_10945 [Alkalispirochaeta sp.]